VAFVALSPEAEYEYARAICVDSEAGERWTGFARPKNRRQSGEQGADGCGS